uniref:DUF5753 domain-containing protein n=2 Tax=Nonomuraea gerenzanensis TaxID=93944 RepID=A0A1M4EMR3_9ACTN|nr:hypothetical protein BN4615_P9662 [Nonomuraea gerenzanensis]
MRAQLDRLANISTLTNVRLGVVPWSAELPRVPLHGFAVFDGERVVVETYTRLLQDLGTGSTRTPGRCSS